MTGQIKIESNRAGQTGSDNLQQAAAGPAPLVIGIGNDLRGDDGVGLWIARRLKAANLPGVRIEIQTGEAATLIESWQTTDSVILIDAVYADAYPSPGKIYRIDAHRQIIPARFRGHGTHRLGAALAVEMARALDRLPRQFILYGIEGNCFVCGSELTPAVERAAGKLIRRVIGEIANFSGPKADKNPYSLI